MMNDSEIVVRSPHIACVCAVQYSPYEVDIKISTYKLGWFYYLADGIYPDWKLFAKAATLPCSA